MRHLITLNNNKKETGPSIVDKADINETYAKAAGHPAVQVRQNKIHHQYQPYSSNEHGTILLGSWTDKGREFELAEEDMNDPDLAMNYSGSRGYMLHPG
jgi:hypothetical protein